MLTVSMPTYLTPPAMLARAVLSVLDQTYPDVHLVVVNDGGPPLSIKALPKHDRLTVYELPENHGRYFCDALVLDSVVDGWFAVHDSDDWSEPDRFARLIEVARPSGAAIAHYWRHQVDGRTTLAEPALHKPDGRLHHLGHWCSGVYSIDRMESAGGIHPGFHVGFDTVHTLMIQLTGKLAVDPTPGYHWQRRRQSLSTARETQQGSRLRHQTRLKLDKLYGDAWRASRRGDPAGQVITDDVPAAMRDEIRRHADKLTMVMG